MNGKNGLDPRPSFYSWLLEGLHAGLAKIPEVTSRLVSVGVSKDMPSITLTSLRSACGQVVVWFEYFSSETDSTIAS